MARSGPVRSRGPGSPSDRELLTGFHPVREALRARRRSPVRLWVQDGRRVGDPGIREVQTLAREAGVAVEIVPAAELQERAGEGVRTQGLALEAGPIPSVGLEVLASAPAPSRIVALDGVEDPQNMGAIVRVAEGAGAAGLLVTRRRAPPLSPAVARASAGALEHLPVAVVTNLPRAINALKDKGFWVFGTDPRRGKDLFSLPDRLLRGRQLFVFGSEERGLREGIARLVDHPIRIPLRGQVESLNVAAAAAVVLFEALRRHPDAAPRQAMIP